MADIEETPTEPVKFNFAAYPEDTLFYDRRTGDVPGPPADDRPVRRERRRRVDPTTFEKQYADDELEFMNAMQRFKVQSGKTFPSHTDILGIAHGLGYRKPSEMTDEGDEPLSD